MGNAAETVTECQDGVGRLVAELDHAQRELEERQRAECLRAGMSAREAEAVLSPVIAMHASILRRY